MKNPLQKYTGDNCQIRKHQETSLVRGLAGTVLAILLSTPAAFGANDYFDVNGTTAGFGIPSPTGTYGTAATGNSFWTTDATGVAAPTTFIAADTMVFGIALSDLGGSQPGGNSFSVALNSSSFAWAGGGLTVNCTNVNITLTGTDNTHINATQTWWVTNNSSLTVNFTHQTYGTGQTALNWNNKSVTFAGGGTFNFPTPFGANSTAVNTENNPGGVINLQMNPISTVANYTGGFTLTAGTLNFASAGTANIFNGFNTAGKPFAINGGTVDNTSGSPLALTVGSAGYKFGGNFTFTGSSSLDFGTAMVTNTFSPTITVSASTLAIGGSIVDGGLGRGLTKVGNGTLLLYGASTYSGNTIVNAGTLALTNGSSIASSALTVSNATLDVSGLTAATVLPSLSISNSTLVIAGLASTTTNIMTGTLNVGGTTNIVNVTTLPLVTGYPAIFHIIKGTALNGTLNFGLGTIPSASPAYVAYITNITANSEVDLVLTTGPVPVRALTWSGLSGGLPNGTWDVASTPTWLDASSSPTIFNELDFATFNDSAAGLTTVTLSGGLTPGSLIISNNALAYTFNGGSLSDGAGSLTLNKMGPGTLLLQESGDSFSGGINVSGGTVVVDNDSSGINGGATIGAAGTIQVGTNDTAGVLPTGTVTVNGTLIFNRSDNITVANTFVGNGALSQINNNTVTLSGTSSGNWTATITNGTLQTVNNASLGSLPGGTVTITNGGTLDLGGNTTQNNANYGAKQFNIAGAGVGGNGAIINSAGVAQEDAFQNIVLTANAAIGGPSRWDMRNGSPLLNLAGFTLTKTNANQISLVSPHVTSGNIVIQQGTLSFESTPNFDASAGTITVNNGGYVGQFKDTLGSFTRSIVLNGGGTTNLSGNGSVTFLDAPILLAASSTLGSAGGTETFNGVISDGGSGFALSSVGTGTNILAATNTYSGDTFITEGALGLTNQGSIASSPLIVVTNGAAFDISGLAVPFTGTNELLVGDDVQGSGTFILGKTVVNNFNYLSISNAVLQMAVANTSVPEITVTNLNLGDGVAASTITITSLPITTGVSQFPLIKYTSVTGTYTINLGLLPSGYNGNLVNNTVNNSIDLAITTLPSGIWNGGSATGNNWSDAANWNNTGLAGSDALNFAGTTRLNTTNDTASETATYITFLAGAGAFTLNGNPVTLAGGITNSSSSLQTIDLGLTFNANETFDGGSAGLILGGGLTNTATAFTTLTLAGNGTLTNLLNTTTTPGGTNSLTLNSSTANWTLVDNSSSTPMTNQWPFEILAGTFNFGNAGSAPVFTSTSAQGQPQDNQIGTVTGSTGTLNMVNGTLTTFARLNLALANNSTGTVNQVGGTLNIGNQFQGANGATSNALSIVNVSGGTMNIGGGTGTFYVASRDQGTLTVSGSGVINCGNLDISRNANGNARGTMGVVNLNGGTLSVGRVGTAIANSQAGPASSGVNPTAMFNFNGGMLQANSNSTNNSATFFQGSIVAPIIPITTIVKSGGAVIDDGGFAITMLEPLQHDATLGGTADGGLIKKGSGILTLTAASTYTGNTVISNGTLAVNGSLGQTAVRVLTGATLSGAGGSFGSNVTVNVGGTIAPAGAGAIGTLTVASNLTLLGTNTMDINHTTASNDRLNANAIAYGGTLSVTNLSGTLTATDTFKLFNATAYTGVFAAVVPTSPQPGLGWNTNTLASDGTLRLVQTVNVNPTNITATVSGNTLTLTWPFDHTGWRLQAQTNSLTVGLSTNWVDVPGATATNQVSFQMNPANGTVFYRMIF